MKKFNVAIAFLNDDLQLEKNNFFVCDNVEISEENGGRCHFFTLNKNIEPVNYSNFISENGITSVFNEDELNYNFSYKCYFFVSSTLSGNKLKLKLINELINNINNEILRLDKEVEKCQQNLKCLFDLNIENL